MKIHVQSVVITALCALAVGCASKDTPDYQSKLAEVHDSYNELLASVRPDADDARSSLRAVVGRHPDFFESDEGVVILMITMLSRGAWSEAGVGRRMLLDHRGTIDDLRRTLLDAEALRYTYGPPTGSGELSSSSLISDYVDDMSRLRLFGRLLRADLRYCVMSGDWDRADENIRALEKMLELQRQQLGVISMLNQVSEVEVAAEEIRALLREADIPATTLTMLREAMLRMLQIVTDVPDESVRSEMFDSLDFYYTMQIARENDGGDVASVREATQFEEVVGTASERFLSFWRAGRGERSEYLPPDWREYSADELEERMSDNMEIVVAIAEGGSHSSWIQYGEQLYRTAYRARDTFDRAAHRVVATIAAIDLELYRGEHGAYPDELPGGVVDLIPSGIRYGKGIVYEVSDDRRSYTLRLPPEAPVRWREYLDGVYPLERSPLDEQDRAWLEWYTELQEWEAEQSVVD